MRQFNLQEFIDNPSRKVVTRDGRPVRILCTDRKSYNEEIVGLVMNDNGMESVLTWIQQGKVFFNSDTPNDLFFAPEKQTGWINVFRDKDASVGTGIFNSKEEAEEIGKFSTNYVTTIKIEWED